MAVMVQQRLESGPAPGLVLDKSVECGGLSSHSVPVTSAVLSSGPE